MADESGELSTDDGRTIAFSLYGPADGHRVVFHYGTPGTRLQSPRIRDALERNGIRLLVQDRPGYGASKRWPGRSVADVATDVELLAGRLGWARFAVWGGSGGGPHALACARLLPEMVSRCACVVGPAPYDAEGLDWFAGMSPGNVEEFSRAREGEAAYRPLVERLAKEGLEAARAGEIPISEDYNLPDSDVATLRSRVGEPGYLDRMVASLGQGVDGWIDDCIAFTKGWGFSPADIRAQVSIWYGPDDVLCPRAHAEWLLSHVPGAERHELPAGHVLEDAELDSIYRWLRQD